MKASILIPTYNYARFIGRAIESVLVQRNPQQPIEIIVIDYGSTDDTAGVLQPYISNGTIQYHYQPNSGKAVATQKGIALAEFCFRSKKLNHLHFAITYLYYCI